MIKFLLAFVVLSMFTQSVLDASEVNSTHLESKERIWNRLGVLVNSRILHHDKNETKLEESVFEKFEHTLLGILKKGFKAVTVFSDYIVDVFR